MAKKLMMAAELADVARQSAKRKGGEAAGVVRIDMETNCCLAADVPLQLKGEI